MWGEVVSGGVNWGSTFKVGHSDGIKGHQQGLGQHHDIERSVSLGFQA
jgi:hypothetical protein